MYTQVCSSVTVDTLSFAIETLRNIGIQRILHTGMAQPSRSPDIRRQRYIYIYSMYIHDNWSIPRIFV